MRTDAYRGGVGGSGVILAYALSTHKGNFSDYFGLKGVYLGTKTQPEI